MFRGRPGKGFYDYFCDFMIFFLRFYQFSAAVAVDGEVVASSLVAGELIVGESVGVTAVFVVGEIVGVSVELAVGTTVELLEMLPVSGGFSAVSQMNCSIHSM